MYSKLFQLEEEVFKVLANEKRLEIMQLLRNGELNVSDMILMLGLRQANLSQHLTLLRQVGLVDVNKKGREIYYRIADEKMCNAIDLIHDFVRDKYNIGNNESQSPFPIVVDPICGMRFSACEAYDKITKSDGTTAYFCASGCRETYLKS